MAPLSVHAYCNTRETKIQEKISTLVPRVLIVFFVQELYPEILLQQGKIVFFLCCLGADGILLFRGQVLRCEQFRADLAVDLGCHLRMVLQVQAGIVTALGQALVLVGEERAVLSPSP